MDDDSRVLEVFRSMLENAGYQIVDGKQAKEHLRNQPVDLLIIDIIMPENEGLEPIKALTREQPNLKIIAMSGAFDDKHYWEPMRRAI